MKETAAKCGLSICHLVCGCLWSLFQEVLPDKVRRPFFMWDYIPCKIFPQQQGDSDVRREHSLPCFLPGTKSMTSVILPIEQRQEKLFVMMKSKPPTWWGTAWTARPSFCFPFLSDNPTMCLVADVKGDLQMRVNNETQWTWNEIIFFWLFFEASGI